MSLGTWHSKTVAAKESLVASLHNMRIGLIRQAKAARVRRTHKPATKRIEFKTKELAELFYQLPKEMRDLIG